jgi:hypothetical protein
VITALARFDGWPVAVIASNPFDLGGRWTAASSPKSGLRFRTAEKYLAEEPVLCEFANLAAPLRHAGPTAFGLRP